MVSDVVSEVKEKDVIIKLGERKGSQCKIT